MDDKDIQRRVLEAHRTKSISFEGLTKLHFLFSDPTSIQQ
jgi:hypothetical protein